MSNPMQNQTQNIGILPDLYDNSATQNTGGPGPLGSWISAGGVNYPSTIEAVIDAQFLILWYNTAQGKYEKRWAKTDEEAVEAAKKLMDNQSCARVEIFELCHRWTRTWEKQP